MSWWKTKRTNRWRLNERVMMKAHVLRLLLRLGIVHETRVAEVDLRLVAGRRLDADGHVRVLPEGTPFSRTA